MTTQVPAPLGACVQPQSNLKNNTEAISGAGFSFCNGILIRCMATLQVHNQSIWCSQCKTIFTSTQVVNQLTQAEAA